MTAGILTLSKHDSGANPASYLSLLVNLQPKLAEMVKSSDQVQTEIFSCHLTHETDDFNTLE